MLSKYVLVVLLCTYINLINGLYMESVTTDTVDIQTLLKQEDVISAILDAGRNRGANVVITSILKRKGDNCWAVQANRTIVIANLPCIKELLDDTQQIYYLTAENLITCEEGISVLHIVELRGKTYKYPVKELALIVLEDSSFAERAASSSSTGRRISNRTHRK